LSITLLNGRTSSIAKLAGPSHQTAAVNSSGVSWLNSFRPLAHHNIVGALVMTDFRFAFRQLLKSPGFTVVAPIV